MKKFWKWCLIVKDKKNIYKNNWIETGEIPKGFKAYELNDFINKKNFKIIVIIISVLVLILAVFSMNFKKKEEKKNKRIRMDQHSQEGAVKDERNPHPGKALY